MAVTPPPLITTDVSDPPNRGQEQSVFSPKMDAFLAAFNPLKTEQNDLADWMEDIANGVETDANAADASAIAAAASAVAADLSADAAAASLATAVMSAGTQATSTTSLSIGYGSKAFTLAQTGKAFAVGQFVSIASAADPSSNWMNGAITAFNSGTGAITVDVTILGGSGTYTDWAISQSAPMVDSLHEIGDMIADTERGTLYQKGGKTFLRTGTVLASASYPEAATDTGLMVNGLASTLPTNVAVTGYHTNGTGTWIAAYGNATNVLISTDNMATWTNKAHNNANAVVDVKWNAAQSRFITYGNSNTTISCSYSATGATFTGGGTYLPGVTPVAGTVRAATDGTTTLCAWRSTTSNTAVATTADGVTLTARTLSSNLSASANVLVAACVAFGAARWQVAQDGSANTFRSTASDASAWADSNALGSVALCGLSGGSSYMLAVKTDGSYYRTTDGITWSQLALPSIITTSIATTDLFSVGGRTQDTYPNWLYFDGTRIVTGTALSSRGTNAAQGLFGYTTDGLLWSTRQLTFPCEATALAQLAVMSGNGYLGTLPAGVANQVGAQRSATWISACDYVGKARPVYSKGTTEAQSSPLPNYVMISR